MADNQALDWAPRRPARGLTLLYLLGFLVCLLLGLTALGALWTLTRPAPIAATASPADALLRPDQVLVGLAPRVLAGDSSSALIAQALQAGELDSAVALLLFDTSSPPATRAALWQQLARRLLDDGDSARAAVAYDRLLQLAVLDTALPSLSRSQLLIQATSGLAAAGEAEAAADAARQAVRSIAQAPNLLPAQRSDLLQDLRPLVSGPQAVIDDPALAAEVDELLRNPYVAPAGVLIPSTWNLLQAPLSLSAEESAALAAAADARRLAARNLADRDVLTSGIDIEPERLALGAALVQEDALRMQSAQRALASATTLQEQLSALFAEQLRLIEKLQVAHGAFGLSLVPEWEAARPTIEADLTSVTAGIDRMVGALADAQATPLEQNLLRAEAAHWLAVESVLGYFPGADPAQISERLRIAQDELNRLGSAVALPVAWDATAPIPGFRLQPAR